MNSPVDQYAVVGNPIAHSRSPAIHRQFAEQTGQHLQYTTMLAEIGHFAEAVDGFRADGGKGLNITVPFKQDAWSYAEQRSERAELAGAVNTLSFHDGQCLGDNTDGSGLVRDLTINHSLTLTGKRLLLLGAGGAVRGVLQSLLEQQPAEVVIANRTTSKALDLADRFKQFGPVTGTGLDAIPASGFDLIINGTAASLMGERPPMSETCINRHTFLYDMMYGAEPSAFMQWGSRAGAERVHDGLGMLVEQAAESFFIWRQVWPETQPVIEAIRELLD